MDYVWVLVAFWIGGCAGFGLFAMMQVARDSARETRRQSPPLSFISDLEADTLSRF